AFLRANVEYLPLALFAPILVAAYILSGLKGVQMFHWYMLPVVPFYLLGIVASARAFSRRVGRRVGWVLGLGLIAWTGASLNLGQEARLAPWAPLGVNTVAEDAYSAAGR